MGDTSAELPLVAYRVLAIGSLRFDGIKHRELTAYEPHSDIDCLIATGRWNATRLETMSAVFALQRWLCHWGGEQERHDGTLWWAFRSLFLKSIEYPVPEEYRGPRWEKWKSEYLPRIDAAIEVVRREHEATDYSFSAPTIQ